MVRSTLHSWKLILFLLGINCIGFFSARYYFCIVQGSPSLNNQGSFQSFQYNSKMLVPSNGLRLGYESLLKPR
ncbi:MAG: hypothetical protein CK532_04630 [Flavobacteriales bacterium]|nr:MAG: hypothetical protein CK532_04630 [Flavobacteriales bacterium]